MYVSVHTHTHARTHARTHTHCAPEECLEVLRQLSTSCVARVHGDEEPHCGCHEDLHPLKQETLLLVTDGILDGLDLYGHNREDLNRDAVELIKAAPRSSLGQTLVDIANGLLEKDTVHTKHYNLSRSVSITIQQCKL